MSRGAKPLHSPVNFRCIPHNWHSNLHVRQIAEIDTDGDFTPEPHQMTHAVSEGPHEYEIQDYRTPKGRRTNYGD